MYTDFRLRTKDEIIMITEDGQEDLWIFDKENLTLTFGGYTFYEDGAQLFENGMPETEKVLNGTYLGTYYGCYTVGQATTKENDYSVKYVFNEDGTAEGIIC